MTSTQPTIYFGYGSNLWLEQMRQRCPTSAYLGLARLNSYHWIISSRGYANVVEDALRPGSSDQHHTTTTTAVYGLAFSLQPSDVARLDASEGVPWAYTKEQLHVDFWAEQAVRDNADAAAAGSLKPERREMLVYIDRRRTDGNFRPKAEYVVRMNNGIADALAKGVPEEYIREVLRAWIPEQSPEEAREKAVRQALRFEDED